MNNRVSFKGYGPTGISYTGDSDKFESFYSGQTILVHYYVGKEQIKVENVLVEDGLIKSIKSLGGSISIGYLLIDGKITNQKVIDVYA